MVKLRLFLGKLKLGKIGLILLLICSSEVQAQEFRRSEVQAKLSNFSNNNGVAVADYDGDNDLDVFIVARQEANMRGDGRESKLFQNNNDGTFTDVTVTSGINSIFDYTGVKLSEEIGYKLGASWGDIDNDGLPDLFLTSVHHVELYRNNGGGNFSNLTTFAGFEPTDNCNNTGATWLDFDNDGFLDLFVTKWSGCTSNRLYRNLGNLKFKDVTESMGFNKNKYEFTWSSTAIDANNDGWLDIYVINDFGEDNELYINQEGVSFENKAEEYGIHSPATEGMGIATGDYNNDGLTDIYVTNIGESDLYENTGNNTFTNKSFDQSVINSGWAWGTDFGDMDNDGDQDLMVLNGYNTKEFHFLYQNQLAQGQSVFENATRSANIEYASDENGLAIFDYDNDGDLDMLISNTHEGLLLYDNSISEIGEIEKQNWARIELEGTVSNRDAIGAVVEITSDGLTQYHFYNGVGFLAQSLKPIHFGVGSATEISSLKVKWPAGTSETYTDLPVNRVITVVEEKNFTLGDLKNNKIKGCTDPNSCNYDSNATLNDGSCEYLERKEIIGKRVVGNLREEIYSYPETSGREYQWEITNGEIAEGQGTSTIRVRWGVTDSGLVSVTEIGECYGEKIEAAITMTRGELSSIHSVARLWNEVLLEAIRGDYARPTVHARNLFHTSVAMYDAWAVFNKSASTYLLNHNLNGYYTPFDRFETDINENQAVQMAISYAVYNVLSYRFQDSPSAAETLQRFDDLMSLMAYDIGFTSTDYSSGDPAALGNYIAESVISYGKNDGAREESKYSNAYYTPGNEPLTPALPGNPDISDPNRWQPLQLRVFIDQSGNPRAGNTPEFLSPEWGNVWPFALTQDQADVFERNDNQYKVYHDPGTPPLLSANGDGSESDLFQWNFALVSVWSSHLDPTDGVMWDISPASIGNIDIESFPLSFENYDKFYELIDGGDGGKGHAMNPVTNEAYQAQMVPRGDYARVLAEFWADGPDSETPPGHWFTLLNYVNDHPDFTKKFGGEGVELDKLEWDVKSYFLLGGAMHDAAISAWSIKGWYDYIRPISAIRYMADLGQSSDESLPSYNPAGISLIDGKIELVGDGDDLVGDEGEHMGKIKILAWRGPDQIQNEETDQAGVGWILAENWWPYQRPSFVTPPFAGYVSGHSTYSRAAAEIMTLLTGSEYFPGGMGEFVAKKNEFLVFEEGPSQDVVLQWATYRDASDQCSLSRIWGGIHPPVDDIPGRIIGEQIGKNAFQLALDYFEGRVLSKEEITSKSKVYPNPLSTSEYLSITNTKTNQRFELFDLSGKAVLLLEKNFDPISGTTRFKVPSSSSNGIYILKSEGRSWRIKVKASE
ncbi:MAG: VCBS repeat-containing protein [Cyclobacteriaceae bacterium]